MIKTLEDLSDLLHQWYGEPQGTLSLAKVENADLYAPPLVKAWSLFGGLLRNSEEWFRYGTFTPLCCQDGFAPPALTVTDADMLHFAFENQGNWSMGYKRDDKSADPQVLSNWAYTALDYDPGFVQVGSKLSELLITLCLQETVYFGRDTSLSDDSELPEADDLSGEQIWQGRYYNAVGIGEEFELPSHLIHSNADQTELILYLRDSTGKVFDRPSIAKRSVARERYRNPEKSQ